MNTHMYLIITFYHLPNISKRLDNGISVIWRKFHNMNLTLIGQSPNIEIQTLFIYYRMLKFHVATLIIYCYLVTENTYTHTDTTHRLLLHSCC